MELTGASGRPRGHERRRGALISASGVCSLSPLPNDMEPHLDALNLPRYFTHDGRLVKIVATADGGMTSERERPGDR